MNKLKLKQGCDKLIKFIGFWVFEFFWCLSNLILKPRKLPYDKGMEREIKCNKFDNTAYQNREKKKFKIRSDYGYQLSCELMETPDNDERKVAVLCHGFGYAKYGCIKYAELFLKMGFTVLMYDHRNHGLSDRALTTMGYYEKYDLKKVIDWCYENYGGECKIVTHGESMGAATVLMHLGIDNRVKCAISDCGYADLIMLLRHQLKQFYHLPRFLLPIESLIAYLRAGFWFQKVSPIRVVSRTDTPILFIHGKIDNLVPAHMSEMMYDCKKDKKAIYLVAKARHAESYCTNREGYEKRVEDFVKRYV